MGARGPVPNRSTERMGHRTKAELAGTDVVKLPAPLVAQPPPGPGWHPIARDWYDSLARSAQAMFYEPSDWAAARYVAQVMTGNLAATKFNGQLFSGIWAAMNDLLTTEGSRRRVKLEIERVGAGTDAAERAGAAVLDEYRKTLAA